MKDSFSVNRTGFATGAHTYGGTGDAQPAAGPITGSIRLPEWKIADAIADDDAGMKARSRFPAWKRGLDLTCILLTSPIWLPLMILIMLMIKFVSRGPVFFRQERVGLGGARFMILKFRSMHVNAETTTHENYFQELVKANCPMTKLDPSGDSRLITGGTLLRATGLDELPQLFNVICGHMSLVGPRPCTPAEFDCYEDKQKERFHFPPGLTGYWQVNGKNKTTFSEMIELDIKYGGRMSVRMDVGIMFKTIPVLLDQVLEYRKRRHLAKQAELKSGNPPAGNPNQPIN